jgi:hypothetical protein
MKIVLYENCFALFKKKMRDICSPSIICKYRVDYYISDLLKKDEQEKEQLRKKYLSEIVNIVESLNEKSTLDIYISNVFTPYCFLGNCSERDLNHVLSKLSKYKEVLLYYKLVDKNDKDEFIRRYHVGINERFNDVIRLMKCFNVHVKAVPR